MSKCVSCKTDLPPQTRFCGVCGATQPSETNAGEPDNIETVRSNPLAENPAANIPPPPPQSQPNTGERQKRGEMPAPSQEEGRLPAGQSGNPPSGPRPQAQTQYDDYQQALHLQQPHSNYQPAPQSPYGDYQFAPQSQPVYGDYPPPAPQSQPPYNYQPMPQPQPPYGNYPPPQSYANYPQPPLPSAGMQVTDTIANVNTGTTGTKPATTGTQSKVPAWARWAIIAVVAVVILAGSGLLLLRLLPHPIPTIGVTSSYNDNGIPAGAADTSLHVTGQQFATNSTVTFLLDNTTLNTQTESDAKGNIETNLKITPDWSIGQHKLTAHDAGNNITDSGKTISIVKQGYNGTPGPNGSPTNTASFKVKIQYHMQYADNSSTANTYELDIKGVSDSQGGTVCANGDDGSQQKDQTQLSDGTPINIVSTYTCSGTYKAGQITYNDTLNTRVYSDKGGSCSLNSSQPSYIQITGTYKNQHDEFSGNITLSSISASQYTCTGDLTYNGTSGASGTWTGTVSNSGNTL